LTLNKVFRINSLLPDARRCNSPTRTIDYQSGEAGNNGGNSEPDGKSLQAETGMSKLFEPTHEPSSFTTAYTGYWLSQKARIRARQLEI
jgi:hypothetical protein